MSTMLIDDEKFRRVYRSLCLVDTGGGCLAGALHFPAAEEQDIDAHLRSFVQALRTANINAYNERYDENQPSRILCLTEGTPYTPIDLIKALRCIRYNIDDQNVKGCRKRLEWLVNYLMEKYILELSEYQQSDAW